MGSKIGYFSKILWVNLTTGNIETQTLDDELYKKYLGGYGLGVKLLYDRMKPGVDPLGPESVLGFLPGLFTGTVAPFAGRYMVVGKSPLTGTWGDSNSGGYFGPAIKACGVDGIFFIGQSEKPVYLYFDGNEPKLLDAVEVWGKDAVETELAMQKTYGKKTQTASIGQAGENLSLISGIVNNMGRIAGRSGFGAVMGSKKLKAIVLNGNIKTPLHDADSLKKLARNYNQFINKPQNFLVKKLPTIVPSMAGLMRRLKLSVAATEDLWISVAKSQGTTFANSTSAESGDSPVKNWGGIGYLDYPQKRARKIAGLELLKFRKKPYGCASCPLRCGAILSVPGMKEEETHRPEYETACMFGTLVLSDDLHSIIEINEMCNRAGIDSISAGATLSFAVECFEKGLITAEDTGGIELKWGNIDAIKTMLRKMIDREGFGNVLADGVKKASEHIQKGSEKYAIHAGGQELPAHDPKLMESLAITYTTDPTPGRHTAASIDFADQFVGAGKFLKGLKLPKKRAKDNLAKAEAQALVVGLRQAANAMGYCEFGIYCGHMPVYDILNAITGWKWKMDDVLKTGYRIQNLRLAFTLREGINPLKTSLPDRVLGIPAQPKGPNKGVTIDLERNKKEYYEAMGWNPITGIPLDETLRNLGLQDVIGQI
ncbi:aldehyde ferredoxin oxidoreductase family protein [bacterium]|nr:aldehyde ferredoxin oxidoreductase family protein [bacterium]